jgi:hypothetical protein
VRVRDRQSTSERADDDACEHVPDEQRLAEALRQEPAGECRDEHEREIGDQIHCPCSVHVPIGKRKSHEATAETAPAATTLSLRSPGEAVQDDFRYFPITRIENEPGSIGPRGAPRPAGGPPAAGGVDGAGGGSYSAAIVKMRFVL